MPKAVNIVSVLKDKFSLPAPVVGVCCVEGGTRCSKWWQNLVSALRDKFPLPPVVGVCCVEGETIAVVYQYVVYVFVKNVDVSVNVNVYAYLYFLNLSPLTKN